MRTIADIDNRLHELFGEQRQLLTERDRLVKGAFKRGWGKSLADTALDYFRARAPQSITSAEMLVELRRVNPSATTAQVSALLGKLAKSGNIRRVSKGVFSYDS